MSAEQSGASSTLPPFGTVWVTSCRPVKLVSALSQETVANGRKKQSAIRAKSVGESQRRDTRHTLNGSCVDLSCARR
jgi:hypothetical protein